MTADPRAVSGNADAGAIKTSEAASTKIMTVGDEPVRGEVSAATIGRMLGLASMRELNLLDTKLDLVMSKVNNMTVRLERVLTLLGSAPTGKDLERIDVQIAALRTMLRESAGASTVAAEVAAAAKRPKIQSSESEESAKEE
ncbi:MAG: hypothetical protein J0M12_01365 [Deltaproteobacteria bacterium]|nr:hypothetical protein [Deltaproteobacteria bacterium]